MIQPQTGSPEECNTDSFLLHSAGWLHASRTAHRPISGPCWALNGIRPNKVSPFSIPTARGSRLHPREGNPSRKLSFPTKFAVSRSIMPGHDFDRTGWSTGEYRNAKLQIPKSDSAVFDHAIGVTQTEDSRVGFDARDLGFFNTPSLQYSTPLMMKSLKQASDDPLIGCGCEIETSIPSTRQNASARESAEFRLIRQRPGSRSQFANRPRDSASRPDKQDPDTFEQPGP
jgi:hypothetical protein